MVKAVELTREDGTTEKFYCSQFKVFEGNVSFRDPNIIAENFNQTVERYIIPLSRIKHFKALDIEPSEVDDF